MTQKHAAAFSLFLMAWFLIFSFFCAKKSTTEDKKIILKIGTTKEGFKSASLLGDTFFSLFAHISNPPLMDLTQDGNPEGLIVDRHETSDDCKTWKFYLHPKLYWSDGTKVTAEDARFSIELLSDVVPHARWLREIIAGVFVDENDALVLELKKPYSRLDFDFTTYNIFPKHIWENIPDPLRHTSPGPIVGCGPFVIEKIDLNSGVIRFKKNPYWKGHRPQLDGIEVNLYSNYDVLAFALEKGEVDTYYRYASSYPYPNIARLKATGQFDFMEEPQYNLRFLGFNLAREPMADLRFREALCYALDYEEIIKLDILGYGEIPNRGFIPAIMPNFKETQRLQYDRELANKLLSEAGYVDGDGDGYREFPDAEKMKLSILISKDYVRLAELVMAYLRAAGIDANLKTVDYNTWISMKDKNDYDLVVSRTSPWGMFMHASWATGYFDARRTGEGVLHNVHDVQFLQLCDAILTTKDREKLNEYASHVQDYYARNLPAIALYWSRMVIPYRKRITGWSRDPLYGIYNLRNFLSLRLTDH
jgi:peptide/nickel transport system substrate-binding protein